MKRFFTVFYVVFKSSQLMLIGADPGGYKTSKSYKKWLQTYVTIQEHKLSNKKWGSNPQTSP